MSIRHKDVRLSRPRYISPDLQTLDKRLAALLLPGKDWANKNRYSSRLTLLLFFSRKHYITLLYILYRLLLITFQVTQW